MPALSSILVFFVVYCFCGGGWLIKYIPNVLSISRIIFSLLLLILTPFSWPFMTLYVMAGVTDMIDGPIARKTKTASELGANLDGAADFVFAFCILFVMIPILEIPPWIIIWIAFIAIMRVSALVVSYIRHKEVVLLHTYGNKIAALTMFAIILVYSMGVNLTAVLIIACSVVMVAFIEDFVINSTSKVPRRDVRGLFFEKKIVPPKEETEHV